MKELEVKARAVLTGRVSQIKKSIKGPVIMCAVDGCLRKATVTCKVKVTNRQLVPTSETHPVHLCNTHYKAFDTLKWEWRRTAGAGSSQRLKLDGVYALDTVED